MCAHMHIYTHIIWGQELEVQLMKLVHKPHQKISFAMFDCVLDNMYCWCNFTLLTSDWLKALHCVEENSNITMSEHTIVYCLARHSHPLQHSLYFIVFYYFPPYSLLDLNQIDLHFPNMPHFLISMLLFWVSPNSRMFFLLLFSSSCSPIQSALKMLFPCFGFKMTDWTHTFSHSFLKS